VFVRVFDRVGQVLLVGVFALRKVSLAFLFCLFAQTNREHATAWVQNIEYMATQN
jgi:hypothetical protein